MTGCLLEKEMPDIRLMQEADLKKVSAGAALRYVITITNKGEGEWYGTVTGSFPAELKNMVVISTVGIGAFELPEVAGNLLTIADCQLGKGDFIVVECTANVAASTELSSEIKSTAAATGTDSQGNAYERQSNTVVVKVA